MQELVNNNIHNQKHATGRGTERVHWLLERHTHRFTTLLWYSASSPESQACQALLTDLVKLPKSDFCMHP